MILSLLCILAIGRSTTHAQKLEKLVIGYPAPVASLGIIDVMRKAGLFKKNGLDIDLVYIQGSPILTTAMVSGQVPLSFLGGAAIVASAVGGADTVYLACGINTLYWRFFTTPNIKTIADLKGKTLGVTTIGSQEDSVVRFILRDRGLIPDRDFAVVAVGGAPTRLAALSKGVISGSTFIPPQDIAAEKLGLNPLIDMSKLGLYNPGSCFASTKTYIKNHRDTVMRVMKTFVEGLRYYKDNRDFVLKVTADFAQNRDPEVLRSDLRNRHPLSGPRSLRQYEGHRVHAQNVRSPGPARQNLRPKRGSRLELHSGVGKNRLHRCRLEKINRRRLHRTKNM